MARLCQIEEHLVGIEGFMIGIDTPGQIPAVQRLLFRVSFAPY
jgi:hypothetical protein